MERLVVGETVLPSGRTIERLALLAARPPEPFKLLMADDGVTIYARQYPHMDTLRPDEWDEVGPYSGGPDAAYASFGFEKVDLKEFVKDA